MFQAVDLFGKSVILYFNGKTRAKTRFGGIYTICFFGFIIWAILHVSQDMIWRKNPKIVSSEFFSENPSEMVISPDTFTLAFGVQNPNTFVHYIDDSVYTLEVIQNRQIRTVQSDGTVNVTTESRPLSTERCTTSHFGDQGSKFADLELDQLFCFTPEQTTGENLTIQGVFESPIYEYLSIGIIECNESTSVCAPADTRKFLLEGGWFAVYFSNLATDPRDYNNPVFKYRDSQYTTFGNNYFKEMDMWLSHVEITSDVSWLFSQQEEQMDFIKFDSVKEMFNLQDDVSPFFRFILRVGKITTHYERTYMKIQDVLAEVNGLVAIGILSALIIVGPYANLKFYEGLINELFDVKMLSKDRKERKSSKKKSKDMNTSARTTGFSLKKNLVTMGDGDKTGRGLHADSNPSSRRVSIEANSLAKRPLTFGDDPEFEATRRGGEEKVKAKDHTRNNSFMGGSFSENMNALSMEIDEDRDDAVSRTYSGDTARNPFKNSTHRNHDNNKIKHHKTEAKKNINECETQDLNQINRGHTLQTRFFTEDTARKVKSEGLILKALASPPRDKPKAVQPQFKLLENYDQNKESVEAILETLILDNQDRNRVDTDRDAPQKTKDNREEERFQGQFGLRMERRMLETKELLSSEYSPVQRKQTNLQIQRKQSEDKEDQEDKEICSIEFVKCPKNPVTKNNSNAPDKDITRLKFSFWDYVQSYFWKSPELKEKISVLNEGKRRINERLDIFNVFKKLREVDKLKLLLLENEQLVLFDSIPKPELASKIAPPLQRLKSTSKLLLKEAKFISEKRKTDLIAISYDNLKRKHQSTLIDAKLMEIFDDIVET